MSGVFLQAYQTFVDFPEKIKSTKISKVTYLLKLQAQRNSVYDLDQKHKDWAYKEFIKK